METLSVSPVQWSRFHNIDEVAPLSERDAPCLLEVREVLRKHGAAGRFGVALLHSHFTLQPDEVMLEVEDESGRTLITRPIKEVDKGPNDFGTICALNDEGRSGFNATFWCRQYCKRNLLWGHSREHASARSR